MPLNQILIGIGAKLDMGSHRHKPLYTHYPVSVSVSVSVKHKVEQTVRFLMELQSYTTIEQGLCIFGLWAYHITFFIRAWGKGGALSPLKLV